jgi:hypothetical protein
VGYKTLFSAPRLTAGFFCLLFLSKRLNVQNLIKSNILNINNSKNAVAEYKATKQQHMY